jgi:hypothetical protein
MRTQPPRHAMPSTRPASSRCRHRTTRIPPSHPAAGRVSTSEGLFADGVEYSRLGDSAWQRSRMTHAHSLAKAQEKRSQSAADTCKNLGSDAGAGAAATLYSVHSDEASTDSFAWFLYLQIKAKAPDPTPQERCCDVSLPRRSSTRSLPDRRARHSDRFPSHPQRC